VEAVGSPISNAPLLQPKHANIGVPARGDRLKAAGGATIPLLVVVSPTDGPIWKSELYTPGDVVAAIERAAK